MSRMQLDACIARQDTERKLRDDIAYAKQHDIHGTPLVVINGRQAPAFPAFLYALILADGNPDASAFGTLPAPRALQAHEAH
jgi:protein-disulfide isomerase